MLESTLAKVLGGHAGHRAVMGFQPRKIGKQPGRAQVHRGQPGRRHRLGDRGCFDTGDESVAIPFGKPGWRRRTTAGLGEGDRPTSVLPEPRAYSVKQFARIGVRCLDKEGYFTGAVHFSSMIAPVFAGSVKIGTSDGLFIR